MGGYTNPYRNKLTIKDEGIPMSDIVDSINFTGAGVTGTILGTEVTETIPGGGAALTKEVPVGLIDSSNKVFTVTNLPQLVVLAGITQSDGGEDFTLTGTGPYTITFVFAPPTNSSLITFY
jgi:hypothetical protein